MIDNATTNAGSSRTSVDTSDGKPTREYTNSSTARKFSTTERDPDSSQSMSDNSAHISGHGSSLRTLAVIVDKAAEAARRSITVVKEEISRSATSGRRDKRDNVRNVSDDDMSMSQHSRIAEVSGMITGGGLETSKEIISALESSFVGSISAFMPQRDQGIGSSVNFATPEIDNVSVEMNKTKGVSDCFYSRVTFSIPTNRIITGRLAAIRVFRSMSEKTSMERNPGRLTLKGVGILSSANVRSRSKNQDYASSVVAKMEENGVDNSISALSPMDPTVNVRRSSMSERIDLDDLDKSVSDNVDVMKSLITQADTTPDGKVDALIVGKTIVQGKQVIGAEQARQILDVSRSSMLVVDENNKHGFREIAFISPDKLKSRVVGGFVEYVIEDETICFGRTYKYYVSTVDISMNESMRSQIVEITVDGLRVPESPRSVSSTIISGFVALSMHVDDKLVEKFEIYRKSENSSTRVSFDVPIIASRGFATQTTRSSMQGNDFIKIGESANSGGSTFYDRTVTPGTKYVYRVYSVDVFGNKSERPNQIEVFVADQSKTRDLTKPNITAEIDSATSKVKLTMSCDDKRVRTLLLARRDLTIHQKAFTVPSDPNVLKFGLRDQAQSASRFLGEVLYDSNVDVAWNGRFDSDGQEITFIDHVVSYDHTYQYSVVGIDKFGNSTSHEYSKPISVVRRSLINAPIDLSYSITQGPQFTVAGVNLSWRDGNLDVSSEDRLGDRDLLSATSVRTLYQVERKKSGDDRWHQFALTEDTAMFDATNEFKSLSMRVQRSDVVTPKFRPDYVEMHNTYQYRVRALQTGTYVSNYSRIIEMFVDMPISAPANFRILSSDTKVKPFYVMLNWDTAASSGIVDRWEIQRAEINNVAAARINTRDPSVFGTLAFQTFRTVYRESSRFRSSVLDGLIMSAVTKPGRLIVGEHCFQDTSVSFGNTYVYRIRAESQSGALSEWSYRGAKINDEMFDAKLLSLVTDSERSALAAWPGPMTLKSDFMVHGKAHSTFSLQPMFSKPTRSS